MKSPRAAAHPLPFKQASSTHDHLGFSRPDSYRELSGWQIKKAGFSLRTKNEHMNNTKLL
jgi:hypothetical protein